MNEEEIDAVIRERIQAKFLGIQEPSLEILFEIVREELLKEAGLHESCYCSICTFTGTA